MGRKQDYRPRNEASRNKAKHHKEPWSQDEIDILMEFWDEVPEEDVAETLGRTIEACRQRHYQVLWGHPGAQEKEQAPGVYGWIIDNCDSCGRATDVFRDRSNHQYCEDCRCG